MTTTINNEHKKLNVPNLRFKEFQGEWEKTTIGEIATIKNGPFGSVLHAEDYVDEGMPIVTTEHFKSGNLPLSKNGIPQVSEDDYCRLKGYMLETDDIVFSRVGSVDINAHVEHVQQGWLFSGRVLRVRPIKSVNSLCLHYVLSTESVKRDIRNRAVGQTMPSINTPILSNTGIYMSQSEAEQKKIANLLSLIDERISTQNKIIEDLKKLKCAIAERLFNVTDGDSVPLTKVCTILKGKQINGEFLSEKGKYYVMNGGTEPSGYYDKSNAPADTISISEGGNSCGYIQYNREAFWSGGHCYTLNNITHNVCKLYLYHYLKSQESSIMKLRIGTGLPNIQKKDLEKFCVLLPSKAKQENISTFLTAIESKIANEEMLQNYFQEEKQYLLRQMFI